MFICAWTTVLPRRSYTMNGCGCFTLATRPRRSLVRCGRNGKTLRQYDDDKRLWAQYCAFQSDWRVLTAWRDLLHTAWVFSTDGRQCRFLTKDVKPEDTLVSIS